MPIYDDYLEELIRRWTASVKDMQIDDWSKDAQRSRLQRYRRRQLKRRIVTVLAIIGLAVAWTLILNVVFG